VTKPEPSSIEATRFALPPGLIHDLRTPLNVIIGYSELMIEQAQEQGQETLMPDLQKTRAAGLQLLSLIDDKFRPIRPLETPSGFSIPHEGFTPFTAHQSLAEVFPEHPAPDEMGAHAHARRTQGLLLVVDDIEANRVLLSGRLERQGYEVATAENGRQALERLRADSFDLVLLDIMMPIMDGYEVLQRLKADASLRYIPVIMISALNDLDSVVRCIEMGAEDYLGKPFNPILLKARIGACLEKKRVRQAERGLEKARQLLEVSRQAGMAEVATNILHNVGNVLNSVNVSSRLILDKVERSKVSGITKAVTLLEAHKSDLPGFFQDRLTGQRLLDYLSKLDSYLAEEQVEIQKEVQILISNILHIKKIVAMQQSYARVSEALETLNIEDLVEDAVQLNCGALETCRIKVVREYSESQPMMVDKHKVLQILVNLIRNAMQAFTDSAGRDRQITLRITKENNRIKIAVIDNGIGIPKENMDRIFGHGFTTRKDGHGFGLHSGALTAKELGGTLTVFSEGSGRGSKFTLELPIAAKPIDGPLDHAGRSQ
jgi:two-component system, sensor histidine kinase ChiS